MCVGAEVLGYNLSDADPAPLGSVAQLVKGWGVGCFLTTCNCQQATLLKLARKKNELSRAIGRFARSLVHGRYRVDTCAYPKLMSTANLVPTVHVIGFGRGLSRRPRSGTWIMLPELCRIPAKILGYALFFLGMGVLWLSALPSPQDK